MLSGTKGPIERAGDAVFLIGPETNPADFKALTDGMHILEFTRLANDGTQRLFADITVVAGRKHAGVAESFVAALKRKVSSNPGCSSRSSIPGQRETQNVIPWR